MKVKIKSKEALKEMYISSVVFTESMEDLIPEDRLIDVEKVESLYVWKSANSYFSITDEMIEYFCGKRLNDPDHIIQKNITMCCPKCGHKMNVGVEEEQ